MPILMPGRQLADCASVQSGAQSSHVWVGETCAEPREMGGAACTVKKTLALKGFSFVSFLNLES